MLTGTITDTYHYQRISGNSEYSYWLLELENSDGKSYNVNVSAERESLCNLKNGDVITGLRPMNHILTSKIKSNAEARVTTNAYFDAIVVHHEKRQQWSKGDSCKPEKPQMSPLYVFLLIMSLVAAAVLSLTDVISTGELATLMTGIPAIGLAIIGRRHAFAKYKKDQDADDSINTVLKQAVNISRYDMGYHLRQRPKHDDDIFCGSCNLRIASQDIHCPQCGAHEVTETIEDEVKLDIIDASTNTISAQLHRKTANEVMSERMAEFIANNSDQMIFQHVLGPNKIFPIETWCYMVRVINREASTAVKNVAHTYRTEITDKYGDKKTSYATEYHRYSPMETKMLVRDSDGNEFNVWLPNEIKTSTDIGDMLMLGYSTIEYKKGKKKNYSEFFFNLTKQRQVFPKSVLSYTPICIMAKLIMLTLASLSIWGFFEFDSLKGIALFASILILVFLVSVRLDILNRKEANRIIHPIMLKLNKAQIEVDELNSEFSRIG